MKRLIALCVLAALPLSAAVAADAPAKAAVCVSCHGPAGAAPIAPNYPVLAGQYANYLEHSLKQYKSGERKNPIMAGQVANLSDQDIKALAAYFEAQAGPLYTPTIGGVKAAAN